MHLRTAILLSLSPALIPLAASILWAHSSTKATTLADRQEIVSLLADDAAMHISACIEKSAATVASWSRNAADTLGIGLEFENGDEIRSAFQGMLGHSRQFSLLLLASTEGELLQAARVGGKSDGLLETLKGSGIPVDLESIPSDSTYVLTRHPALKHAGLPDSPTLVTSFPTRSSMGEPNGRVVVFFDWGQLEVFAEESVQGMADRQMPGGACTISTPDGQQLTHSGDPEAWEDCVEGPGLVETDVVGTPLEVKTAAPSSVAMAPAYVLATQNLVLGIVTMALLTVLGLFVALRVTRCLRGVGDHLAQIASGGSNLRARIPVTGVAEVKALAESFNKFVGGLHDLVRDVQSSAQNIGSSASVLDDSITDISHRTSTQAAALEEIRCSLRDVSRVTEDFVEASKTIETSASTTHQDVDQGSAHVEAAASSMEGIAQSSREIGKIIDVVQDIAFQTNMLALNAAVEAARAGESGKGFAVVAGEVRALAGRASEAAQQTESLIDASIKQIEAGDSSMQAVTETFDRIRTQSLELNEGITGSVEEAKKQSSAFGAITAAIIELDETANATASSAEQIASGVTENAAAAAALSELVSQFEVDD